MSLTCDKTRELIPLFPDDLDLSEAEGVREHVASCTACAAELGVFLAQAARFAQLRTGRPSVDLFSGIREKLARPEPVTPELVTNVVAFPLRRVAFAAAAAGVAIAIGILAFRQGPAKPDSIAKQPEVKNTEVKKNVEVATNPQPEEPRRVRAPRPRIFEAEDSQPLFRHRSNSPFSPADAVEVVPLDEEAEVPQAGKRTYAEPQPARPAPKGTDDDRSLSF
jgi:hypothetical protein